MFLWIDALLVERLSQPVADFLTRLARVNCYTQALLAAGLALCFSLGTLISFSSFSAIYAKLGPDIRFVAILTPAAMILADAILIGRSWYLKRTARAMAMSPDRIKLMSVRVVALGALTIQLIVMNTFTTMGVAPGLPSWLMLAHHFCAVASLYLMACTPMQPPPKTVHAPVSSPA